MLDVPIRNTDGNSSVNSSVLWTDISHADYRAKTNLYPPRIGQLLTFRLATYILYMYKPSIRVGKGFFLAFYTPSVWSQYLRPKPRAAYQGQRPKHGCDGQNKHNLLSRKCLIDELQVALHYR